MHIGATLRLRSSPWRFALVLLNILLLASMLASPAASARQALPLLRVGALNYGTVNWELEVVRARQLAEKHDIRLEVVLLASENALAVALQSNRVDLIVSDWLWVAHQREAGRDYQFAPYSLSVGAVMLAPGADIDSVADLAGRKLGIAGGPVDKTWLLLRAYAQRTAGIDLAAVAEPTYAAPPMINRLMETGELPAAINFWHYNARLEAQGMRSLLSVEQMLTGLHIDTVPPLLGWVFAEDWANRHRRALRRFLAATYEAKAILAESDAAWEPLRELVNAESDAMFAAIKAGYRAGILTHYGPAEIDAAQQLFKVLAEQGGGMLTGDMRHLDRDIFWDGFRRP